MTQKQTMLTQNRLAIHLGKPVTWVRAQGDIVVWRDEVWERVRDDGRVVGYTPADKEKAEA